MILELLEVVIFQFTENIPPIFAGPTAIIGLFGLYFYNKIQEPIKESFEKQLCAGAMAIGVLGFILALV